MLSRRQVTVISTLLTVSYAHSLQVTFVLIILNSGYGNEAEVGQGIKAAGVPRSELFITGKCTQSHFCAMFVIAHMYLSPVWSTYHTRVEEQLDISLKDLGTDYLDLFLIHCKPFSLYASYNFAYRQYR
jgi:glycerol 2-dehydrogenase (NADP+)